MMRRMSPSICRIPSGVFGRIAGVVSWRRGACAGAPLYYGKAGAEEDGFTRSSMATIPQRTVPPGRTRRWQKPLPLPRGSKTAPRIEAANPSTDRIERFRTMNAPTTSAPVDVRAPTEPEIAEGIALLLNDPLPTDWQDSAAIAARQTDLAGAAHVAAEAVLEAVLARAEAQQQAIPLSMDAPEVKRVGAEIWALVQALRRYVHETQRGDGRQIVMHAMECSAGAALAKIAYDVFDRMLADYGAHS